ncbi:hypothetical protein XA68_15567 [Ophiocordyceps unilateralis]|uniref:Uncharacterized protein n=1 Tax=Ophiocordyceps unilateralis TaxID=268505 RepID=A0A2A9P781_OPHUN|nr:hypothetical protein XA68_15567 [Ophiocordyceps unilateralis]
MNIRLHSPFFPPPTLVYKPWSLTSLRMARLLLLLTAIATGSVAANELVDLMRPLIPDRKELPEVNGAPVEIFVPCPAELQCKDPKAKATVVTGPMTIGITYPEAFSMSGGLLQNVEAGCTCSENVGICSVSGETLGPSETKTYDSTETAGRCSSVLDLFPRSTDGGKPTDAASATASTSTGQANGSGVSATASSTSTSASTTAESSSAAGPALAMNQVLLGIAAVIGAAIAL